MRIGLLSDTHGFLDESVFSHFDNCDEIWHAGDVGSLQVLGALQAFKPLRAVWGNVDGAEIRSELTADLEWECEGARVYMTHIGGHPGRYDAAAKKELVRRKPDVFVCGHSHILRNMWDPAFKLLYMNPGACGHQGWHATRTIQRLEIAEGKVTASQVIDLGRRGTRTRT